MMQTPDGANAVVVGHLGSIESSIAIVGGNCSIQGFDHKGEEAYWTVSDCVDHVCLLICNCGCLDFCALYLCSLSLSLSLTNCVT